MILNIHPNTFIHSTKINCLLWILSFTYQNGSHNDLKTTQFYRVDYHIHNHPQNYKIITDLLITKSLGHMQVQKIWFRLCMVTLMSCGISDRPLLHILISLGRCCGFFKNIFSICLEPCTSFFNRFYFA